MTALRKRQQAIPSPTPAKRAAPRRAVPVARLAAWLLVPLTLAFAAGTAFVLHGVREGGERDLRRRLEGTVEALALAPADSLAAARLEGLAAQRGYERVWLVEAGHRIAASSRAAEAGGALDPRWRTLLEASPGGAVMEEVEWGARTLLFAAARRGASGTWALVLHDTTAQRAALRGRLLRLGLGALALWLAVAALVYGAVRHFFARPVAVVDDAVRRVAAGEVPAEATLQRLHTTAARSLGGVADLMVEQARAQRATQERAHEAAALFASLFDLVPALAFVCSFDGLLLDANRAFCERLGLLRESILGKPFASFKPLLPVESLAGLGERSRAEACVFDRLDFTFKRPDGHRIPVTVAVQALPFQGQPSFLVVAEDRTDVRELQRRLASFNDTVELMADERAGAARQSAELLERVLDEAGAAYAVVDAEGRVRQGSRGLHAALAAGADERPPAGRLAEALVPEPGARAAFGAWLAAPAAPEHAVRVQWPEGAAQDLTWRAVPLTGYGPGAVRLLVGLPAPGEGAAGLAAAVGRLEAPLAALVRLAEVVGTSEPARPEDRHLLRKAGLRLHQRFQELAQAARTLAPATEAPAEAPAGPAPDAGEAPSEPSPHETPAAVDPLADVDTPAVEDPAVEDPAVEDPAVEDPAVEDPAVEEPAAGAPDAGEAERPADVPVREEGAG